MVLTVTMCLFVPGRLPSFESSCSFATALSNTLRRFVVASGSDKWQIMTKQHNGPISLDWIGLFTVSSTGFVSMVTIINLRLPS
jgi:hypothetical protein